MRYIPTSLQGVYALELDKYEDERGYFGRTFCREDFSAHGLSAEVVQCNISHNTLKGTLRGLHWQVAPYEEIKLVRCVKGAIFDVAVDIRPSSKTFGQYVSFELSAENAKSLYIPEGMAHGFQTLTDDATVVYQVSSPYSPESARTLRWNDPALGIPWPFPDNPVLSEKDRNAPLLKDYE